MIHTTLWLPLLNGCCKRLFWHCIVFWWPLLLRRDHYCSEAKTWPNVSTVSWDIYDPIPKFHLNMMRVKTSLLSLQAGFTCASSKKIFGGRAAIPWGDWGQGTHFSLADSPCGMAAPLPRNSLFSAHSLRRMVAPPPKFSPNLHKRACSQGIGSWRGWAQIE